MVSENEESIKNHQKHSRGFQLIDEYMNRDFPVPDNAEDYVYMSQLLQAYGITKGIEAQRRAKPYNMGTLYWQLNDCWPSVSWSSIDYFGNWKALHYKAKHSFEDVLISSKVESDTLKTWVVNDKFDNVSGRIHMMLMDFDGHIIWENTQTRIIETNVSQLIIQQDLKAINFKKQKAVLVYTFKGKTSFYYFVKPKDLQLNQGEINTEITKIEDGFTIELSSKTFQKDVFLFTDEKGHFSDNFFDMLPDKIYSIHFKTKADKLEDLNLKSFNNFIR